MRIAYRVRTEVGTQATKHINHGSDRLSNYRQKPQLGCYKCSWVYIRFIPRVCGRAPKNLFLFSYKEYTKPQNCSISKMAVTTPKRKKDSCSTLPSQNSAISMSNIWRYYTFGSTVVSYGVDGLTYKKETGFKCSRFYFRYGHVKSFTDFIMKWP